MYACLSLSNNFQLSFKAMLYHFNSIGQKPFTLHLENQGVPFWGGKNQNWLFLVELCYLWRTVMKVPCSFFRGEWSSLLWADLLTFGYLFWKSYNLHAFQSNESWLWNAGTDSNSWTGCMLILLSFAGMFLSCALIQKVWKSSVMTFWD